MSSLDAARRRAFSETSDPAAYLPRTATEETLRKIGAWADSDDLGSTLSAFIGTPGIGKTMLLRLIETRAVRSTDRPAALYLPYLGLGPEDLCVWVHGLLGVPIAPEGCASAEAAIDSLLQLGEPLNPFFLLVDDADSMPAQTLTALIERLPTVRSPLRILMALNPDSKASRLISELHNFDPPTASLRTRLTDEEAGAYLRGRMRWAGVADVEIAALSPAEVNRLNALAGGIPRQLHRVVLAHYENQDRSWPDDLMSKARREDWLTQPLNEDSTEHPG